MPTAGQMVWGENRVTPLPGTSAFSVERNAFSSGEDWDRCRSEGSGAWSLRGGESGQVPSWTQ